LSPIVEEEEEEEEEGGGVGGGLVFVWAHEQSQETDIMRLEFSTPLSSKLFSFSFSTFLHATQ
jgi:hypothetical protein